MSSKQFKRMLTITLSLFTFLVLNISNVEATFKTAVTSSVSKTRVMKGYGNLPLSFIQNDGQMDEKVKYYERGNGHTTFFTKDGMILVLSGNQKSEEKQKIKGGRVGKSSEIVRLIPLGANKNPEIVAEGKQEAVVNYFIGNDSKKWKTKIPTYQAVLYKEIYPDIDMRFYGNNRQFEYDVIVKPGADPSTVRFGYEGVEGLKIAKNGALEIALKEGKLTQSKPYIYQEIDGRRVEVEGKFVLLNQRDKASFAFGFEVASYNKTYPLTIDPVLVYSTYLGGTSVDTGHDIAVDGSGNVYITGETTSGNFPTASPFQSSKGNVRSDIFITKINATGTELSYSTFLGGFTSDIGLGIAVDNSGNAYVTGITTSSDFPMKNPIQGVKSSGSGEAFITKINSSGSALIYSTFLGGDSRDRGYDVAVDVLGNAYITGLTSSNNFPTTASAFQTTFALGALANAFVTKINPSGSEFVYSTYLGGSNSGHGRSITVDNTGNAYITGGTASLDFPTESPIQASMAATGTFDVFITKINPSGSALVYSTFLGGATGSEEGFGIAVDSSGNAYIAGSTGSTDFPTQSPLQAASSGGSEGFVAKINATGSTLMYSTYFGSGGGNDAIEDIGIDDSGNAYATGNLASLNAGNAFLAKIDSAGSILQFIFDIGSGIAHGIAVDGGGSVYVVGDAGSTFPTVSAIQGTFGGGRSDAFVVKISASAPIPDITVTPLSQAFGDVTVGITSKKIFSLSNNGNADLLIGTIAQANELLPPFSRVVSQDNCSNQILAASTSCDFVVQFAPSASTNFKDTFDIPSNDLTKNPVTISVSGTGTLTPLPDITVTPLTHTFRNITEGNILDQTITIKNDGSANLDIGTLASPDGLAAPFSIQDDLCSNQSIVPAGSCIFKVHFAPTTTGAFNDTFDISSNDTDENPAKVSVSGTGLSSAVNQLPTAPQLVSPGNGAIGLGSDVTFEWNKSTDPDGDIPSYTLKVCEDVALTLGCFTSEVLAAVKNKGVDYAGLGIGFSLAAGFVFIGRLKRRRTTGIYMAVLLVSCMLLASCGGGGSDDAGSPPVVDPTLTSDITKTLIGLKSGTTYHWQVVADDGNGGTANSEIRSFTTQ